MFVLPLLHCCFLLCFISVFFILFYSVRLCTSVVKLIHLEIIIEMLRLIQKHAEKREKSHVFRTYEKVQEVLIIITPKACSCLGVVGEFVVTESVPKNVSKCSVRCVLVIETMTACNVIIKRHHTFRSKWTSLRNAANGSTALWHAANGSTALWHAANGSTASVWHAANGSTATHVQERRHPAPCLHLL